MYCETAMIISTFNPIAPGCIAQSVGHLTRKSEVLGAGPCSAIGRAPDS